MDTLRTLLGSIPGARWSYQVLVSIYWLLRTDSLRFVRTYPPGHYYSPLPDYKSLVRDQALTGQDTLECPGIDLREEAQLELMEVFSKYYDELPWTGAPNGVTRYHYENDFFGYGDAITMYSLFRNYKPSRVVEVGSGYSSAAMMDVNDLFLEQEIQFTFVEPYPERLLGLLRQEKPTMLRQPVQEIPLETFRNLDEHDVLFVDSSHVVKAGSDLQRIIFTVLPALKPGVLVHFHDIFWPFAYPGEWFREGRA